MAGLKRLALPDHYLLNMAVRVEEFSNGVDKIRKIFAKESTYSKEIIESRELG